MDLISVIVGLIIGGLIGFLVSKKFSVSNQNQEQLEKEIEASKESLESYKVEVSKHLENSAILLGKMNETCQGAMKQMEESTQLLKQATPEHASVPFFAEETQAQLRETIDQRKRTSTVDTTKDTSMPPRDYSSEQSGIFIDKKQSVTNEKSESMN